MAGVGQCASLKVRKCVNPCVFTVNLAARGRESSETLCTARCRRDFGAGAARVWRATRLMLGKAFL